MKLHCIYFTAAGEKLADRPDMFPSGWAVEKARGYGEGKVSLKAWTKQAFAEADALLFIGAAGIAVRAIAAHVRSKLSDPAVLVMDEGGRFVIPLLSGHIGGANRLAAELAKATGATPVLTTATDVNGLPAIDEWAAANGLHIDNPAMIKDVSGKLLAGECVTLYSDVDMAGDLPQGFAYADSHGDADVCISPYIIEGNGLMLIPPVVSAGVGCRKGVSAKAIQAVFDEAMSRTGVHCKSICGVYSIDLKKDEAGLLEFCDRHGYEFSTFTAGELAQVEGSLSGSSFVKDTTGVDNVCERAALTGGGRLIQAKLALNGVTVALALRNTRLSFEEWT